MLPPPGGGGCITCPVVSVCASMGVSRMTIPHRMSLPSACSRDKTPPPYWRWVIVIIIINSVTSGSAPTLEEAWTTNDVHVTS